MSRKNTQRVVELLKSIETGDSAPVAYINATRYVQHNVSVGDGLTGFADLLQNLPTGSARVNTVRVFEDGDFVFAHTDYLFFGPKIGFDIFRFDDGLIVEHWDNFQETPRRPNPSGHTMVDGERVAIHPELTQANKILVSAFVSDVLVNGRLDRVAEYLDGNNYVQHNPQIADGLAGLQAALGAMAEQGITMRYGKIHRVLGEGNFVLTVSEGEFAGRPTSFYDLFRVQDQKIVEHWDVLEEIPPASAWKNRNGKF